MDVQQADDTERDPYAEGARAWAAGEPLTANPYGRGGCGFWAYPHWNDGWLSARAEPAA